MLLFHYYYLHSNTAGSPSFACTGFKSCTNLGAISAGNTFNGASVRAIPAGFLASHRNIPASPMAADGMFSLAVPSFRDVLKCPSAKISFES